MNSVVDELMKPFMDKLAELKKERNNQTTSLKLQLEKLRNNKEAEIEEYLKEVVPENPAQWPNPNYRDIQKRDLENEYLAREKALEDEINKTPDYTNVYLYELGVAQDEYRKIIYQAKEHLKFRIEEVELEFENVMHQMRGFKYEYDANHNVTNGKEYKALFDKSNAIKDKLVELRLDMQKLEEYEKIVKTSPRVLLEVGGPETLQTLTPWERDYYERRKAERDKIQTPSPAPTPTAPVDNPEKKDPADPTAPVDNPEKKDPADPSAPVDDPEKKDPVDPSDPAKDPEKKDPTEPTPVPIKPDEEPVAVVKTTPWQWIKNHKKQILIAIGITALAVATVVLITQLLPALVASAKATQTAGLFSQMLSNGSMWHAAAAGEKVALHGANTALANTISSMTGAAASFNAHTGIWTIGGKVLPTAAKAAAIKAGSAQATASLLTKLTLGAGIGGLGALGTGLLIPKRSDEYKRVNNKIKMFKKAFDFNDPENDQSFEILFEQIQSSEKLNDDEKKILFRKLNSFAKKMDKSKAKVKPEAKNSPVEEPEEELRHSHAM